MAQVVSNFVKTTLRAPLSSGDTSVLLATGAGAYFNLAAGDWCYVTINDSTGAEVVKYTSTGAVVSDTIVVERAQDNTTARDFPTGSCVSVGWNVAQIEGLIDQIVVATPSPTDTMIVDQAPTDPPADGISFAFVPIPGNASYYPGLLWYWDGSVWTQVAFNGTQLSTTTPTAAPPYGISWNVNSTTGALHYWSDPTWIAVSGGSGGSELQILQVEYYNPTGVSIPAGNFSFAQLSEAPYNLPFTVATDYSTSIVSWDVDIGFTFSADCIAEISSVIVGDYDNTKVLIADLVVTNAEDQRVTGMTVYKPAAASSTGVWMHASTGPVSVTVPPNYVVNGNLQIESGAGTSPLTVKYISFAVKILAV